MITYIFPALVGFCIGACARYLLKKKRESSLSGMPGWAWLILKTEQKALEETMDRDPLFRGYATGTTTSGSEWVFGDLVHNRESRIGIRYTVSSLLTIGKELVYVRNVVPESVGQFTGEEAIKGTGGMGPVYTGDILEYTIFDCYDNDTQFIGVIKFVRGEFILDGKDPDGSVSINRLSWVLDQDCTAEIIGNTTDNPEITLGIVK